MPQVPVYNANVQERSLPSPRFDPNATNQATAAGFGTKALYQGSQSLADTIGKIVEKEKESADTVNVMGGLSDLSDWINVRLRKPKEGALFQRKMDAFGLPEKVDEEFQTRMEEISDSLGNDAQRAAFQKSALSYREDMRNTLFRHLENETNAYQKDRFESFLLNEQTSSYLNWDNPDSMQESLNRQHKAIVKYGYDHGWSPDEMDRYVSDASTKTLVSAIGQMVNNDRIDLAQQTMEKYKGMIGPNGAGIEKLVHEGSIRVQASNAADEIFNRALSSQGKAPLETEIRNLIEGYDASPEVKDAIRKNISERQASIKSARQFDSEQRMDRAFQYVQAGQKIPDEMWLNLKPEEQAAITRTRDGIQPMKHSDDFFKLFYMSTDPKRIQEFKEEPLRNYRGLIRDEELDSFLKIQTDLREGKGKADPLLEDWRSDDSIITGVMKELKINEKSPAANEFKRAVAEQQSVSQRQLGRKLTNAELENIAIGFGKKMVTSKGWIWDTEARVFKVNSKDIDLDAIPREDLQIIKKVLKSAGRPVSNDSIKELYLRQLKDKTIRGGK